LRIDRHRIHPVQIDDQTVVRERGTGDAVPENPSIVAISLRQA